MKNKYLRIIVHCDSQTYVSNRYRSQCFKSHGMFEFAY